ncbi:hypothetical protein imdm_421 [gamma proteobacterium IMCC2047]|nr:hypothetical protein imdm_421 [gamma proteobacterium IMCC2047]
MKAQDIEQLQAHIENRIREVQQLLDQSAEFTEKKRAYKVTMRQQI